MEYKDCFVTIIVTQPLLFLMALPLWYSVSDSWSNLTRDDIIKEKESLEYKA